MTNGGTSVELSFCIATLNRSAFIGETLDSILSQADNRVEIVIVDGASTDNTEEVVRKYAEQHPNVRYHRRERNMGVDRDFSHAVELARGKYCWLMSDDDILVPGAIDTVLEAVRKRYGLVVPNASVCNADLSRTIDPQRISADKDRFYEPGEHRRLFEDTATLLTFIGCVVIRRDVWLERDKERYFGSLFIHVGVIFQRPLPGGTLFIAKPLVAIRYGNAQWTGRSFEIWMFKWPDLVWSLSEFPNDTKHLVCRRQPWRDPRALLSYRAMGAYSMREYRDLLKPRLESLPGRLIPAVIASIPGVLVNLAGLLYFSLLHPQSGMPLEDIRNSRYNPARRFRRTPLAAIPRH